MAATIKGFANGEIKPQPGFTASASENGGWTAKHEFAVKADDFESVQSSFAKGTLLADLDPDIPAPFNTFLAISETSFSRVEGDLIFLSVTATGSGTNQFQENDLGGDALPTYELSGTLSEVPITDHPKFFGLTSVEKYAVSLLLSGEAIYNLTLADVGNYREDSKEWISWNMPLGADATEFATRIAKGDNTYLVPRIVWTETTEGEDQLTIEQLPNLGRIAEPRGNPPTPATRDWMLTNCTGSQQGNLYRTTLEWTLSERGGWDTFKYEA